MHARKLVASSWTPAMSKTINVFFLVPSTQLGGCTSFTVHLLKTLEALGYTPRLIKIGSGKPIAFPYGLTAVTMPLEEAVLAAQSAPSIIAYCFWRKCGDHARALIEVGVPMVVHDPAEFHDDEIALMKERSYEPLVIRKANVFGLRDLGVRARYVPHPYVPSDVSRSVKIRHALCLARVDFRKRTHMLIEANKTLDAEHKAIHLYGEVNRIYEFHQLRKLHPDWKRWYHGEFPAQLGQAVRMFSCARFAVDLTHIKGDGGGTQYVSFEAWNAGIPLILNKAWQTGENDEVKDGESCVMVSDVSELIATLRRPEDEFAAVIDGGKRVMGAHSPKAVGDLYLEAMGL